MIGFLPLADPPFGADLLNDVVVQQNDAFVFGPPKFVARFVKHAAFSGSRLVYICQAPPQTLSDQFGESSVNVWTGTNQVVRSFRDGTSLTFAHLGGDVETIGVAAVPHESLQQKSSLEVFRFRDGVVSSIRLPAGYQPSAYASQGSSLTLYWYSEHPEAAVNNGDLLDFFHSAVLGPTGDPVLLPKGAYLIGSAGGDFLAATGRREQFYVYQGGKWKAISAQELDSIQSKGVPAPLPTTPPPYIFRNLSVPKKNGSLAPSRRELWVATTDQMGPNRALISSDGDWYQGTPTHMAHLEKGLLFTREIVHMARAQYDALAEPLEKKLFERYAAQIQAAYEKQIGDGAAPAFEKMKQQFATEVKSSKSVDALRAGSHGEIGRYEGRYGIAIIKRDGVTWSPRRA